MPINSLSTYRRHDIFLYVLIYVADLLIIGNSLSSILKFKEYMSSCLHMKDLGPLKYSLGIEIAKIPVVYFYANGSTLWR